MFKGFKQFILRGNVIDLAVAVVIGAACGVVIKSFVEDVLTPIISAIVGKPDFSSMVINIRGTDIRYGLFLNALVGFLLVAGAVYFFMIAPMNALQERRNRG